MRRRFRSGAVVGLVLFALGTLGTEEPIVAAAELPAASGKIPLTVEEPAGVDRKEWPVSSGIPLAEGALRDDQAVMLEDSTGRELPLQTETLVRWPDGSIRWLLVDFQIDLTAKEKKSLTLRYGPTVRRAAVEKPVLVTKDEKGKVILTPGPVRLGYEANHFFPQGAAHLTGGNDGRKKGTRLTYNCGWDGVHLIDEKGHYCTPWFRDPKIVVEQSGPVRACIRVSGCNGRNDPGDEKDRMAFSYVARIHVWRGQPYVRVFYTLVNDRQDVLMAKFHGLEITFFCPVAESPSLLDGKPVEEKSHLFQVDENHYLLDDKPAGRRACSWAAVGSDEGGLAVGLRDFWQNWPKAIKCSSTSSISLQLFPELPAGLYDNKPLEEENKLYYALRGGVYTLKVGVAKTHEFWINYLSGKPDAKKLGAFFQATEEPLLALADPEYACGTKAMGDFPAGNPNKFAGYDAWLDKIMDAHLKQRDKEREYGVLNWGDWYGERKVNWGNLEYDMAHGMLTQYLRTGDRRYFLRGEQASRHHVDVDVIHATNPLLKNPWGAPPQVGEIWLHCLNHTGGYYENAPLPVERTYQMGHSTNFGHVWVGGDFEYYCLTGDRRVREVAVQMADAMVRHCPTAYSDHIRGLGWPIVLVLNAYDATGDKKYLDAATSCWQVLKKNFDPKRGWVVRLAKGHCLHPERTCYGNVPFMEGLLVSALARYHRVTRDPEVLQAITVGIDQMIRECWIEEDKAFRYTACPLSSRKTPYICLAAEGMAYESKLTGNREHLRILQEGLREAMLRNSSGGGKGFAQMIHFMPYALTVLEQDAPGK